MSCICSSIKRFASLHDVQSLAMLTCVISKKCDVQKPALVTTTSVSRATSDYTIKPSHYSVSALALDSSWSILQLL